MYRWRIDIGVQTRLEELVSENYSLPEVRAKLRDEFGEYGERLPSRRTIERAYRDLRGPVDKSGVWGLADSTGEEARLILAVLSVVIADSSARRKSITRQEAEWILRVSQAAPGLSNSAIWRVAILYRSRKALDRGTVDLDDYLALQPWQSPEALAMYKHRVESGLIDPVPLWNLLVEPPTVTQMRGESWPGSPGIRAAHVANDERDKLAWEALSEKQRQRITASLIDESQEEEGKNGKG